MDPMPALRPNNQKENEQINISVPPEGAFKSDFQPQKSIDMRPKNQTPFMPNNPASEIKFLDTTAKAPDSLPEISPSIPDEPSGKLFKMIMAGTIILLTIILIAGVLIFRKGDAGLQPANSPAVSASATPAPTIDPNLDSDNDGIPDSVEAAIGTNPNNSDTDGDGYSDLNEIKNGYSPLIAGAAGKYTLEEWDNIKGKIMIEDRKFYDREFGMPIVDKNLDSDKDGLPDEIEKIFSTDMSKADTDGDGVNDLQEIKDGYNPIIAGEEGKYTSEDAAGIFAKMSAENNEFIMREIVQPALSRTRDKARIASYKATVSSLQVDIVMCCDDNPVNMLQAKEGVNICNSTSGRKLPIAADIYASSIIYAVLGQCNVDNPGLSVTPVGFPVSACNVAATARSSGVVFPEGC